MFASMFLFSFAMSITPGPVNTVILSTSLNHGLKRSLPYISGATIGFTLLLIFMAFGLQSVLTQFPVVLKILAVCGTLFVCYIGIKIILSAANISISSAPVEHMLIPNFKMVSYYSGLTQKHGWLVCRVLPCLLALKTRSRCRSLLLFISSHAMHACSFGDYVVINFQWY